MVACAHCGGCCAHCAATCGGFGGAPAIGIASAFGHGSSFGGTGYIPFVGGVPFFHRNRDDEDDDTSTESLDCDALSDPSHPGHRDAVMAISHVDDSAHESIVKRIKEELAKL